MNIQFAFFQAGGLTALAPLFPLLAGHTLSFAACGPALGRLRALGHAALPVPDFLARWPTDCDLVITDTINLARTPEAALCRAVWARAETAGTPSLAFVDSWWGYAERFFLPGERPGEAARALLPGRIAVVDELARQAMLDLGFPASRLLVLGSPHLNALLGRAATPSASVRAALGLGPDDLALCFVSQPLERALTTAGHWGFTEKTTLAALCAALRAMPEAERGRVLLLVLPHPEEDAWELSRLAETHAQGLRWRVLGGVEPLDAVQAADLVAGMFSILLTEAALLGRPVLSIQLGLAREDMLVTNMVGATLPVRDPGKLPEALHRALFDPACRQDMLARQRVFSVAPDAFARWRQAIAGTGRAAA